MATNDKRFINLTTASITSDDYFVGTRNLGDGTSQDFKYVPPSSAISAQNIVALTVNISGSNSETLEDTWFLDRLVQEIITNQSTYLRDVDFTQSSPGTGNKITWINGNSWSDNQFLRAKI